MPLFLKQQCDRTLGLAPPEHRGALPEPPGAVELGRALRAAPSVLAILTPETVPGAPEIYRNRSKPDFNTKILIVSKQNCPGFNIHCGDSGIEIFVDNCG